METRTSSVVFAAALTVLTACDSQSATAPVAPPANAPAAPPAAAKAAPAAPSGASMMSPQPRSTSSDFEGELFVAVHRAGEKDPAHFDVRIKGPRSRFTLKERIPPLPDFGQPSSKIMFDTSLKKTVVFVESEKAYAVFPTEQVSQQLASFESKGAAKAKAANGPPAKASDAGKLDTVAGTPCEEWTVQLPGKEHATFCVASRSIPGLNIPAAGLPAEFAWAGQFLDGHHLPLRWVHFDSKGVEDGRVEVERIDDRMIDKAEFVVPNDYRRVDLGLHPGMLAAAAIADKSQGGPVTATN